MTTNNNGSSSSAQLGNLFSGAVSSGVISQGTSSMLTGHLGQMVIAGAAGASIEDIEAADVTLITLLIDASSSIGYSGLEKAVRDGQGILLDSFQGSKESDSILVALWTFDSKQKVLHSYVPVTDATRLDKKNYKSAGATVLYDVWCDALAANVAYAQQLRDGGTPCRSVVVVITDGDDTGSKRRAGHCKQISEDLLRSEQFVLAFVGVGNETNFRKVAADMGVPDGCVAVQTKTTPQALRQVFQMVSQSAIRASQGLIKPGANAGFFQP